LLYYHEAMAKAALSHSTARSSRHVLYTDLFDEESAVSHHYKVLITPENELGGTAGRDAYDIPFDASAAVVPSNEESSDEDMQQLVRRVFVPMDDSSPRTVVFCGVDDENSSSSICARVARALAANNQGKVCLVDANVRRPRLSSIFHIAFSLKDTAARVPIIEQCVRVEGNLWLAEPGLLARDRVHLPSPEALKELVERLRAAFQYVLIDAPGTTVCGHAQLLGLIADAAILVIEANRTRRLSAWNAQQTLSAAGVRLLGTVLHNRSFPIPAGLYKML
jgi:Mrp family chromosome partitioning ATPase